MLTLSIAVFVVSAGRPGVASGTTGRSAVWWREATCGAALVPLELVATAALCPDTRACVVAPWPAAPPEDGAEMWIPPSTLVGTNCFGSSGNSGASSASICSVEAVYDWASFII
ncbi:hypothetical protein AB0I51_05705 [Streptomyces sp. NPDC050549]|uniref:hypothetical protein n=1 Tax=Streptomyces sp. NPDC050549 TaxID=3155406 RepID=UPI00341A1FE0